MPHDQAYYQAEKKIEEALKSGATKLNFYMMPLTELPESIGTLKQLQFLHISYTQLKTLPKSLGQLRQLQTLILDHNKLTEVPESLGQLKQLQILHISSEPLTTLPDSIKNLKKLKYLIIAFTQLDLLPKWIRNFAQLLELNVSYNQLTTLPDFSRELTSLQGLDLTKNKLTSLPEWLGKLVQLRSLGVGDNQLTTLPNSLSQLKQLTGLNIEGNQLTALPNSLSQLKQLAGLHIGGNQLTSLPEWIGNLVQLEVLDLEKNKLTVLPVSLGNLINLGYLNLSANELRVLPESLAQLRKLSSLYLGTKFKGGNPLFQLPTWVRGLELLQTLWAHECSLEVVPKWIGELSKLKDLCLSANRISELPASISQLKLLESFDVSECNFKYIPAWFGQLSHLKRLELSSNKILELPESLCQLEHLKYLYLKDNPLNADLAEAYEQGLDSIKAYLRAKAEGGEITLNEAKLILVGEGEVGKTCLMDALLDKEWQEHPSTHGIKIQSFKATNPETQTKITLNAWDFGGQRVYRPTHQFFFSAPAVYLVVWKPREGSQAGQVKEWIQLVKRREPSAKMLVVATHGGPQQRQPDIDRQELWDLFSKDTVVDFFFVESKPDEHGNRKGIDELKRAIAQVAASLPEVGRSVPKSFADVRQALQDKGAPYLPLREVIDICRAHNMDHEIARLFITISHRLGHLTHYENDPTLRDIVILRPDWLATAMSYILDDEATRAAHGLVKFSRLGQLWVDKKRTDDSRYPATLHPIFLRLMERFDLSYKVAGLSKNDDSDPVSLIAQLVPDIRPQNISDAWKTSPASGDVQQTQICHIVDAGNGQSASAEGLFYQLIVRLHKYSLGRTDYNASVHWQRGLVLEDEYKSRAFLEHIGNDVRITVRSPYPEGLLGMLTREVKFLVESFWEGLRCDVMVPCIEPCGKHAPGTGLFEVNLLMGSKRKGKDEFPCSVCGEWQNIDSLLRNAPAAQPDTTALIFAEFAEVKAQIESVRQQSIYTNQIHITGNVAQSNIIIGNKNTVDSSIDSSSIGQFSSLDVCAHVAFSPKWRRPTRICCKVSPTKPKKVRACSVSSRSTVANSIPRLGCASNSALVLWCEHSRLPLPVLNNGDMKKGVYDLDLEREWFKKASPYLKFLTGTLGMVLPVASSAVKLALDETAYKLIEEQLDFGKSIIDATALGETTKIGDFLGTADSTNLPQAHGVALRSDGSALRELHTLLKAKDPGFGGLVRVMNKRQEFLWVHEKFVGEY